MTLRPGPSNVSCDLDFAAEREQTYRAVAGGQGMRDVSRKRPRVADLWTADYAAAFRQAGTGTDNAFVVHDRRVGHAAANDDVLAILDDTAEAADSRGIDNCLEGAPQSAPGLHEQVCSAAHDTCAAVIALQNFQCFTDRARYVIVVPCGSQNTNLYNYLSVYSRPNIRCSLGTFGTNFILIQV
jgi:hypothetical protein